MALLALLPMTYRAILQPQPQPEGIVNKRMGRVGDSPIVGAGVYADNETCAVSATGYGEEFMRTVISKTISDFMYMKGMSCRASD